MLDSADASAAKRSIGQDRKSTRLNSSHSSTSYAVFCFKKKKRPVVERRINKRRKLRGGSAWSSAHTRNGWVAPYRRPQLSPNTAATKWLTPPPPSTSAR